MKTLTLTLAILFSGILSAQQIELNGKTYGSITSSMYKEAKLTKEVSPLIFHELTLAYDGYRIFFAQSGDFIQCMKDYGSEVSWELTTEEQRNLRNYIKRNGGSMPKYRPERVQDLQSTRSKEELELEVGQSVPVEIAVIEQKPLSKDTLAINAVDELKSTSEEVHEVRVISPTYDNRPLNTRREVRVTPPMTYEGGKLRMNGERLSLRKAKRLARPNAPLAFKEFRKARRLRGWNWLWAYYSVVTLSIGSVDGDVNLSGVGVGLGTLVVYREDKRIKVIEKGVLEYNSTLPGSE
jgi:hypothetical protein